MASGQRQPVSVRDQACYALRRIVGSTDLYDRQSELEYVHAALDAAAHGCGGLLVVEGPPGIGKTRLVAAAVEHAHAEGFETLAAHGGQLEVEFPFGLVRQLFELRLVNATDRARAELLAGAAGLARPLLGLDESGEWMAGEVVADVASYPRLHGLYWLAANLAAKRPLVLAVDDLHWADAPSLRWISYLAPRVGELPIVALLATRPAEEHAHGLLDAVIGAPGATVIRPQPLSPAAVDSLVRVKLGENAADAFSAACLGATAGNPFFLHELLADIARAGIEPTEHAAARVVEVGPTSVSRSVLLRLAAMGAPATSFARAVAVLGVSAEHRHVAGLLGVDQPEGAASLVDAGILKPGTPLRFVHPIVRAAIYADLPARERADAHARAARLLADEGAPAEVVSMHLLATPPAGHRWVVESMREAAARALRRGTPAAAAGYLRRAIAEAPAGEVDHAVLAELGHAEVRAGDPTAVEHLTDALARTPEPERRARIALELGRALTVAGRLGDAVDLLTRVLDGTVGLDDDLVLRMEAELINAGRLDARTRPLALRRLARFSADDLPGTRPGERLMLAHHAYEAVCRGEPAETAVALARRALAGGTLLREIGSEAPTYYVAAWALALCDRLEESEAALTAAIGAAREAGSALGFAMAAAFRASVCHRRGALVDAEGDARNALEATEDGGHPLGIAFLVDALVDRGQLAEADASLERIGMLGDVPENMLFQPLLYARGGLRIAQDRIADGVHDLLEAGRRATTAQITTANFRPWRSEAALGLTRMGHAARAHELAGEELALARRSGAPRALGIALRALGLLERGPAGLRRLEESLEVLDGSEAVLERARSLVELGAAKRRRGERAAGRDLLRRGFDDAQRLGADPLAERGRTELAAAGARPRRVTRYGAEALTPSERRVAGLAAEGMSNREIAQALFVTVKTIEWHLAQSYRKLEIAGRAQLAAALAASVDDPEVAVDAPGGRSADRPLRARS